MDGCWPAEAKVLCHLESCQGSDAGRWPLVPFLNPATALLLRVQMMKKKGRKCPHPQRRPCLRLCPQLQTKSLFERTMIQKVGPACLPACLWAA
jgi:hypothetical protein